MHVFISIKNVWTCLSSTVTFTKKPQLLIYFVYLILATTDCPSGEKPGIAEDPEYPGRL